MGASILHSMPECEVARCSRRASETSSLARSISGGMAETERHASSSHFQNGLNRPYHFCNVLCQLHVLNLKK